MKSLVLLILCCLVSIHSHATSFSDTIPLRLAHGLLIIPVQIDGQKHDFILDTGMTRSIVSTHLLDEANMLKDSLQTVDITGHLTHSPAFRFSHLRIGNRQIPPLTVLPLPQEGTIWQCLGAEGFIGNDALQGLMLTIDTRKGYVIFSESRKPPKEMKGYIVPMAWGEYGVPYIEVQVGKLTMQQTLFDTGSTSLFSPNEYSFRQLQTRFSPSQWKGRIIDATIGSNTIALSGATPQDSLWRVEFSQWNLGHTAFAGVSSVAGGQAPISSVGAPLTQYGKVILDYKRKEFYFIPYQQGTIQVKPVQDFQVQYADGHLFVGLVWPRSQAYAQGVRPGMRVTEADGQPLNDDFCRLIRLLNQKGHCTLTLEKEGKSIHVDYYTD